MSVLSPSLPPSLPPSPPRRVICRSEINSFLSTDRRFSDTLSKKLATYSSKRGRGAGLSSSWLLAAGRRLLRTMSQKEVEGEEGEEEEEVEEEEEEEGGEGFLIVVF